MAEVSAGAETSGAKSGRHRTSDDGLDSEIWLDRKHGQLVRSRCFQL